MNGVTLNTCARVNPRGSYLLFATDCRGGRSGRAQCFLRLEDDSHHSMYGPISKLLVLVDLDRWMKNARGCRNTIIMI